MLGPARGYDDATDRVDAQSARDLAHRFPKKFRVLEGLSGDDDVRAFRCEFAPVVRIRQHDIDIVTGSEIDADIFPRRSIEQRPVRSVNVVAPEIQDHQRFLLTARKVIAPEGGHFIVGTLVHEKIVDSRPRVPILHENHLAFDSPALILLAMRKTKIICTIGPASEKPETIEQMIRAGTDIFRLNMSHAQHDWTRRIVTALREIAKQNHRGVAIMMDTQGPAIRTGNLSADLPLNVGDIIEFTVEGAAPKERNSVSVNYAGLADDVEVGCTMLVDNGVLRMQVLEKNKCRIRCKVLTQGTLGSRRHINLPGVRVNLPPLTQKDLEDIALGAELGVDFVALSFARQKSDLQKLRDELRRLGSTAAVVAKIETQSAVTAIDEMIEAADAILIARGDLGIECPMEELPIIQRRIVKRCLHAARPVIVATHLLESMIENPVPTRAEITDVANAVFEQADAMLLTGETTSGRYPVECVKVLARVASRIERSGGAGFSAAAALDDPRQKTVASAVLLANSLQNSKLIVFTRHGTMARYVSNLRPERQIFAFTPSEHVYRQLALCWGTYPVLLKFNDDPNRTIAAAEKFLCEKRLTRPDEDLVILSDVRARDAMFDCVQVRQAKDPSEDAGERSAGESMMD